MSMSTLALAWRNLGRNRRRTFLAVGAIALGQFTLIFVNCMMAGSFQDMLDTITGPFVGHVQVCHPDWREERAVDLYVDRLSEVLRQISALPAVERVSPRIYSSVLAAPGEKTSNPATAEPAVIVGVDPAVEADDRGLLARVPPGALPGARGVALGDVLATRLGVVPGQLLAIIGQDADGFPVNDLFEVRAIINSRVDLVKTRGIVMALEDAASFLAMPDQAHEITVTGTDSRRSEELAEAVAALPGCAGAEVLSWRRVVPMLEQIIALKGWMDLIFLGIVFAAAAAGVANTAMMSTFERRREFGMLLAIGARPRRIVRMVVLESVLLGLLGVAIGSLLGSLAVWITSRTGIDYAALGGAKASDVAYAGISFSFVIYPLFQFRHVVFGVVAVTLTSVLASLWPAFLVARLEPVEAVRS